MRENGIGKIVKGLGYGCIIVGALVAVISGVVTESFLTMIIILLSSVFSGIMLIGFAEIIFLLQLNVYKTEKLIQTISKDENIGKDI